MHIIPRKNAVKGFVALGLLLVSNAAVAQFSPLFTVGKGSGEFLVKRPNCEYEAGVANRAYPYGSEIAVAKGADIFVFLAPGRQVHFGGDSVFTLMDDPEKAGAKKIELASGSLETHLVQDDDSVYPLSVKTKTADFDDFDGRVTVLASADGLQSGVRVGTGKVTVKAPQMLPSRIGTGSGLVIRTSDDGSYSEFAGTAGDYSVFLEHGSAAPVSAEFHTGSRAKVWRRWTPAATKKLAVSILLVNPNGSVADSYAFLEGQPPVKNGVPQKEAASDGAEEAVPESSDSGASALDDFASDFSSDADTSSSTSSDDFSSLDDFSF